jgi:aspartate/methionine/tyrosine aminotransferase
VFSARTDWPATPNRLSLYAERARAAGIKLIDLTVSNPTTAGFTYDEERIGGVRYAPYSPEAKGLLSARQAIAAYYRQRAVTAEVSPENLFILPGTSEGYADLFRLLCNGGDEILIAAPGYPLLDLLATVCDVKLVHFHCFYDHGGHLDLHDLEMRITPRTRAIALVHPNNPTGAYVSEAERSGLASLCAKRDLALIVDEVFLDYALETGPQRSFADELTVVTFTLNGISKLCGLPQMKAAWLTVSGPSDAAHEAIRKLEIISDTFLSASTPVQLALPDLLATRLDFQSQLIVRLKANLELLDRELTRALSCSRLLVAGGWYAILRVPVTYSDEELALSLLENDHVLVEPGHFFDFAAEGYLVLSLMTPEAEFRAGLQKILARF